MMSTDKLIKELKISREEIIDAIAIIESKQKHKEVPVKEASVDSCTKATIIREKTRELIELLRKDELLTPIK